MGIQGGFEMSDKKARFERRLQERRAKPADAARPVVPSPDSGNYVADDDTYPTLVTFADGRTVAVTDGPEGHYLVVSRKTKSYDALVLDAVGSAVPERKQLELANTLEEHKYGQIYLHPSEVACIVAALRAAPASQGGDAELLKRPDIADLCSHIDDLKTLGMPSDQEALKLGYIVFAAFRASQHAKQRGEG
jgi:hypothetical protein